MDCLLIWGCLGLVFDVVSVWFVGVTEISKTMTNMENLLVFIAPNIIIAFSWCNSWMLLKLRIGIVSRLLVLLGRLFL